MSKKRKQIEFSKKIFYVVISLFVIVIIYSMALMWKTGDTSALSYLIPSVGGLATTSCGFYYWKAKMENVIKLGKKNKMDMEDLKELNETVNEFNVNNDM